MKIYDKAHPSGTPELDMIDRDHDRSRNAGTTFHATTGALRPPPRPGRDGRRRPGDDRQHRGEGRRPQGPQALSGPRAGRLRRPAADAFTLFARFEAKLEEHRGNLARSAVELAKDWRSDRVLRRLEALLAVADREHAFIVSGTGDLIEPDDGLHRHRLGRLPSRWRRPGRWSVIPISTPRRSSPRRCGSPPHLHLNTTTTFTVEVL